MSLRFSFDARLSLFTGRISGDPHYAVFRFKKIFETAAPPFCAPIGLYLAPYSQVETVWLSDNAPILAGGERSINGQFSTSRPGAIVFYCLPAAAPFLAFMDRRLRLSQGGVDDARRAPLEPAL